MGNLNKHIHNNKQESAMIYHIVKEKDYLHLIKRDSYVPSNFDDIGFVHCSLEASVISVANDYYLSGEERLLLLKIDRLKLKSLTKFEPAVPERGAVSKHLDTSSIFPHVYGPIDNSAVEGIGVLLKENSGYRWPTKFFPLAEYIANAVKDNA